MAKPKGFKLVAHTELSGTGGSVVRAFYNSMEMQVFLTVDHPVTNGKKVTLQRSELGPFPHSMVEAIKLTLTDIEDLRNMRYLAEE